MIGNADYESLECSNDECNLLDMESLDMYLNMSRLKAEMEQLDFLTMSFVNLNAREYLRSICLLLEMCKSAQKVLVLVNVAGHGHRDLNNDYLIPVNTQFSFHLNDHKGYLSDSFICSIQNLMQAFVTDPKTDPTREKFTVGIIWDTCRLES